MFRETRHCRICNNSNLVTVLDLGVQYLTGVFPSRVMPELSKGPVQLVKCHGSDVSEYCGLVQMRHTFSADEMYGETYGYRSGLNRSMVEHLYQKVDDLQKLVPLNQNDLVLDIGSNDGTLLGRYPDKGPTLVGIDPSAEKFRKYYRADVNLIVDFFSADNFQKHFGERKAKIITSIAMFYDLEDPQSFVNDIASVLADNGIWHLEQSYLPMMLRANSYDTVCHEHIEYYALRQLMWMFKHADLHIINVQLNNTNGGSFAVTVAKNNSQFRENSELIESLLCQEAAIGIETLKPWEDFWQQALKNRNEIHALFDMLGNEKKILGYGASTKGNVLLQFCGITPEMLPYITEVNEDKYGCYTPGTWIPIIPEEEGRKMNPDYYLVLPWHFRDGIIKRESSFRNGGGKLVFPLPVMEIIS